MVEAILEHKDMEQSYLADVCLEPLLQDHLPRFRADC